MELVDKQNLYKIIRDQIVHEDNLINHRLNWILFSQTFLFAAFFTIWTVGFDQTIKSVLFINFLIPIMGSILSWFGVISILDAFNAIKNLRQFWFLKTGGEGDWKKDNHADEPLDEIYRTKEFPDISYKGKGDLRPIIFKLKNFTAANAALNIPVAIILGWIMLFVSNGIFFFSGFPNTRNMDLKLKSLKENKVIIIKEIDTTKIQELMKDYKVLSQRVDSLINKKKP